MPKRSGMNLDALAAAEALANYELGFLLNAQRANRMTAFKARAHGPGFDDLLDSRPELAAKLAAGQTWR